MFLKIVFIIYCQSIIVHNLELDFSAKFIPLHHDPQYEVQQDIVNPHNFKYIFNPRYDICNREDAIFLLIYVHTAPGNLKRRLAIRESWARRAMFQDIRLVFVMGHTEDRSLHDLLALESNFYNDIVQENYIDSYRNLTYKGVSALKWITRYCSQASFVLKTDDDIITNTFIIIRHLRVISKHEAMRNSVMCLVWTKMKVMRDVTSKWYIAYKDFKPEYFTPYCSGSAYMFTGDLIQKMYDKSKFIKFFWVDDFYITGLLAQAINATYHQFNSMYIVNTGLVESRFLHEQRQTAFGHTPGNINRLLKIWKFIKATELENNVNLTAKIPQLVKPGDFSSSEDLKWSGDLWYQILEAMKRKNVSHVSYDY